MTTGYQRAEIIRLLRRIGFNSVTLTYQHRVLGVPDYMIDKPVDAWIDGLSTEQASSVIRKLRDLAGDGEDEE